MVVLDAVQDRLRLCGQKDDAAIFLHLNNVAFPHRYTTATGDNHIFPRLHLDQKLRLQIPEILLAIGLKNVGNRHLLPLCDDLIHLDHFHRKYCAEKI